MSFKSDVAILKWVSCVIVLSLMPIGMINAQEQQMPSNSIQTSSNDLPVKQESKNFPLAKPPQPAKKQHEKLPPEILHKKSFYGSVIGAYQVQGARVLQTTPDTVYDIGEFAGGSFSYVVGVLYRWGPKWGGHFGLMNRNIVMNGNSTAQGSAVVNKFELERNFLGAEMGIHFYPMKSSLSYLANLELSQEQRVRLKVVGGSPIDQSGIKLKPIVLMSAGAVYNWDISPRYALQQELRLGGIAANPPIIVGEARLSLITGF